MKKTIESIEKEINAELKHSQLASFDEDNGIQWIEYAYTDEDGFWASERMPVERYVEGLIWDVELPAEDARDEDDYDDCDEDWMIKLCIHYGVRGFRDLDWGEIIADVESECSVIGDITYALATQIAEQREDEESAALSIDNGATYIEADDEDALQSAIDTIGWDEIVSHMDDDAREQAHSDVSPCTELEYLKHYLEIAPCDLVIG